MKAYIFRHQRGGFDTSRAFLNPITDAQLEALGKHADSIHGEGWSMSCEIEVIEDDTVPEFEATTEDHSGVPGDGASHSREITGAGFGSVEVL
jgi:hypothetical protein